jgi:glycosyltransferase involved in cell wall biosynthesis
MIINATKATQALRNESKLVLISEDFSGHRLDWLTQMRKQLGERDLTVLSIDASRLSAHPIDMGIKVCSDFKSKKELINFIRKTQINATLIFWDADNWIFEMFRVKAPIRALIMRPYLTSKSFHDLVVFFIKRATIFLLQKSMNIDFAYLAIPFCKVRNKRNYWVDDDLIIDLEFLEELRSYRSLDLKKETYKILVPGYISKRKNPELVIEACKFLSVNLQCEFQLTFQGKVEKNLEVAFAANEMPWLNVQNRYYPRTEYLKLLNEADVVVIPYSNIASSGVAVECIALNIPVIMLRDYRWKGASSLEGVNLTLVNFDVNELGLAIKRVLTNSFTPREEFDFRYTHPQTALEFLINGKCKGII